MIVTSWKTNENRFDESLNPEADILSMSVGKEKVFANDFLKN